MLGFTGNPECMKSADGFLLSERSDLINHTEGAGAGWVGGGGLGKLPQLGATETEIGPQQ